MRRIAALLVLLAGATAARAEDAISFGLDWVAEAEYGGYYQAVATGLYAKRGLKVTIRQGGPQVNQMQLMMAGRLDFNLGGGRAIEFVQQGLPFVAIAAIFQKDPSVLIAHPGQGNDSFAALKGKPILVGADTRASWWRFLAGKYRLQRFADPAVHVQPAAVPRRQDGRCSRAIWVPNPSPSSRLPAFKPVVLLLADAGYAGYGNIVTTSTKLVTEKPELVQRFIDASIEGWYSYLARRSRAGEPADQAGQPGDARRAAELRTRRDEDARHRRFRRCAEARHRRDDRCALGGVLSLDGGCRRVSQGTGCGEGLYDCASWTSVSGWN